MRLLSASLLLILSAPSLGQALDHEHIITPFVTREAYQDFCRSIEVDSDQREISDFLYEDYVQNMMDLQAASDARSIEAGADRLEAAFRGSINLSPEALRELRISVQQSYMANWPVADRLFQDLTTDSSALSMTVTPDDVKQAVGDLRRRVLLETARQQELEKTYAGEGLDVTVLVETGREKSLSGVPADQLKDILTKYAQQLNAIIASHADAERQALIKERVAQMSNDLSTSMDLMRSRVERWKLLHGLNEWAIESVTTVLMSNPDPEVVEAWQERVRFARFPWLHRVDQVERIADWVIRNGDEKQRTEVEAILKTYLPKRDAIRAELEELLLSARTERGVILGDRVLEKDAGSQDLRGAHLRLTGELRLQESRAVDQIESTLTSGQRAAARRAALD